MSTGHLGTNSDEIRNKTQNFPFKKMYLKKFVWEMGAILSWGDEVNNANYSWNGVAWTHLGVGKLIKQPSRF